MFKRIKRLAQVEFRRIERPDTPERQRAESDDEDEDHGSEQPACGRAGSAGRDGLHDMNI